MRLVRENENAKKELMERNELISPLQQRRKQWRQRNWASTTLPPWRTGRFFKTLLNKKAEKWSENDQLRNLKFYELMLDVKS